jgi:hypothetical protein
VIRRAGLLVLGLAAVIVTPGAAQTPLAARPRSLPHGYLATTRCVHGVPTTVVDPHLDSLTRLETEAHEAVHRRQLGDDCEARLLAATQDPLLRLEREAEAYCGGLAALGLDEMRQGVAVERLREGLYEVFVEVAPIRVDSALARYCGD